METLLGIVAAVGLAASLALIVWGMVLCLRHGLGDHAPGSRRATLGDGGLSDRSARAAVGV